MYLSVWRLALLSTWFDVQFGVFCMSFELNQYRQKGKGIGNATI